MFNPKSTQVTIASKIGKTLKTVGRNMTKLVKKGYIVRMGSKRAGKRIVIK